MDVVTPAMRRTTFAVVVAAIAAISRSRRRRLVSEVPLLLKSG
jgi:hypothetical protein